MNREKQTNQRNSDYFENNFAYNARDIKVMQRRRDKPWSYARNTTYTLPLESFFFLHRNQTSKKTLFLTKKNYKKMLEENFFLTLSKKKLQKFHFSRWIMLNTGGLKACNERLKMQQNKKALFRYWMIEGNSF